MRRRAGWFWIALILPACLGYQLLVHALIVHDQTTPVLVGLVALCGIPHAAINLALLWLFGRTLLAGREPLITGFARKFHGTLPPHMERYTRRVTIAWCAFFAGELVVSAVLLMSSVEIWSLFVNALTGPLVAFMFVAEYVYRVIRYRDFPHASIWQGVKAFVDDARVSTSTESARRTHG